MSFDIDEQFSKMNDGDVLLAYKGSITAQLITNVLGVVETKLNHVIDRSITKKKIYNVLVESLQNLYHHVDDLPSELNSGLDIHFGIFVVSKINDQYEIRTGNFIKTEKIKSLKERLDKIKSLSKDELKDLYKFVLNNQKFSDKGGGGLGLIDIARRTEGNINYEFNNYNTNYSFFNLNIII
ncbi:MAG TPA: SiaB family protein kinase [Bacteroidales bacterium]|nr:SiaB family protein kinase [Bacteroidales bacterium]